MSDYSLKSDEVILYDGPVSIPDKKENFQLTLTNLNIVLSTSTKKGLFSKPQKEFKIYPVHDIKIYEDNPQIIQKGNNLQIFFLTSELTINFASKIELSKFKIAAMKLVTGKSAQKRGADKVKGTIDMINDTLGIDTVGTVKGVLENGVVGSIVGGICKNKSDSKKDNVTKALETVGNVLHNNSTTENEKTNSATLPQTTISYEEQYESLKKLKELLDAGIITDEEFTIKKKEILGI